HSPKQPKSGEVVTITAKVTDRDGVGSVTLLYQPVDPGNYIKTDDRWWSNWTVVDMHDDGLSGDWQAGDDIYTVQLPAFLQTHRRFVRYRIRITDGTGESLAVPYDDDPQPNFAYFVYDGVPAWRAAIKPGDGGQLGQMVEYGTEVMRSQPVYHLIARADDVRNCQYNSSYENTRFKGALVYDGVVYDHIEFRIRGEYSTYRSGKNKWRFYFTRGHDFQARDSRGNRYDADWRVMNLSACASPWVPANRGMGGLDEAVAFALYNLAGVPSPKTHPLQLRIIDEAVEANPSNQYNGDLWGLYMAIEHPDGRFLDEHGLPDGNVYKMEGGGDKKNQGPTQSADASDLSAFRNGYNRTNTLTWWKENLDLERYYGFRAINRAVNNMDLREGWNVYYYHDPETDSWIVIPWDLDMLYMPMTHWSGVLNIQNCLNHQELLIGYQNRGRELQDLLLNSDQLGQVVDELAAFVNPPGADQAIVDVDRAMWDWNPQAAGDRRGTFYMNPAHHGARGGSVVRTLISADHEGMMQWIKDFTLPPPGGGSSPSGYGAEFLDSEVFDSAIPRTPTVAYVGSAGYKVNGLVFQSSPFSDPQGSNTFAAMKWRVAEVTDETNPTYDPGEARKYEVEAIWESQEFTDFNNTIVIPAGAVEIGHSYRVRCRMKDNTGRWSHWSNPVQFVAGGPLSAGILENLRITELMYNPANPPAGDPTDNDDFEFIELKNIGDEALD
ncbi:MAG: CotH kinase family protein, partial [Phycisphaerales bacterium]